MAKASVKVDKEIIRRVKRHIIDSGQTISEFIEVTLSVRLDILDLKKEKLKSKLINQ